MEELRKIFLNRVLPFGRLIKLFLLEQFHQIFHLPVDLPLFALGECLPQQRGPFRIVGLHHLGHAQDNPLKVLVFGGKLGLIVDEIDVGRHAPESAALAVAGAFGDAGDAE